MDNQGHKQGVRYVNDEDRRKGYIAAQKRHGEKSWTCEFCNETMRRSNKVNHERTIKHQKRHVLHVVIVNNFITYKCYKISTIFTNI